MMTPARLNMVREIVAELGAKRYSMRIEGRELAELYSAVSDLLDEVELMSTGCDWRADYDGNWDTACGDMFSITAGTPAENNMKHCCYCGKPLVAHPYVKSNLDVSTNQQPEGD